MKRQSIVEYGAALAETSVQTPRPKGTEVLMRVHHCGVCHSDIHLQDGYFDLGNDKQLDVRSGRDLPFTLGHEIEGEVVGFGPKAQGVIIGQRRIVYPWIGCHACVVCKSGQEHLCKKTHHLGLNVDGGFSDYVVVPHPRYLLDYSGISPELAGPYMCSGLTAYSALKKAAPLGDGDALMIRGLGGVGMMALQFAKSMFDGPIFACDIDAGKRKQGRKAGALKCFNPGDKQARRAFYKMTGGAQAAVDFVGAETSLDFAQGCLVKGGRVVVAGLIGGEFKIPIPMFPLRAISIIGTFVGSLDDAREMIALVQSGAISPIPIETRPLDQASATLDDLRQGKITGRVVLQP